MSPPDGTTAMGVHTSHDTCSGTHFTRDHMSQMYDQLSVSLRIRHAEREPVAHQISGVPDLTTRFGIKRRAIQHDSDNLIVPHLRQPVAQLILGNDPLDLRLGLLRFIADKGGHVQDFLQSFQGTGLEQLELLLARNQSMLHHGLAEALHVEGEIPLR